MNCRVKYRLDAKVALGTPHALGTRCACQYPTGETLVEDFITESPDDRLFERDIQNYLAKNLNLLGRKLSLVGVEHEVPFGRIDILAVDDDFNHTVIEVKRGIATRDAIGQLQSYMGAIRQKFPDSNVQGVLVARDLDQAAKAALLACVNVIFVKFQVQFTFELPTTPKTQSDGGSLWHAANGGTQPSLLPDGRLDSNSAWPK
jgi:Endonuclease NucS